MRIDVVSRLINSTTFHERRLNILDRWITVRICRINDTWPISVHKSRAAVTDSDDHRRRRRYEITREVDNLFTPRRRDTYARRASSRS